MFKATLTNRVTNIQVVGSALDCPGTGDHFRMIGDDSNYLITAPVKSFYIEYDFNNKMVYFFKTDDNQEYMMEML